MSKLENLGLRLRNKRGERGIREVAKEINISHATLSRVERGHLPDLENYEKLCKWLGEDINQVHAQVKNNEQAAIHVHFRKKPTTSAQTAQALAKMIMAADDFLREENEAMAGA